MQGAAKNEDRDGDGDIFFTCCYVPATDRRNVLFNIINHYFINSAQYIGAFLLLLYYA